MLPTPSVPSIIPSSSRINVCLRTGREGKGDGEATTLKQSTEHHHGVSSLREDHRGKEIHTSPPPLNTSGTRPRRRSGFLFRIPGGPLHRCAPLVSSSLGNKVNDGGITSISTYVIIPLRCRSVIWRPYIAIACDFILSEGALKAGRTPRKCSTRCQCLGRRPRCADRYGQ